MLQSSSREYLSARKEWLALRKRGKCPELTLAHQKMMDAKRALNVSNTIPLQGKVHQSPKKCRGENCKYCRTQGIGSDCRYCPTCQPNLTAR